VRQIGSRWDEAALAETVALYAPIQRELDWPGLLPIETIRYGAGDGQTFELYRPEQEFSEPGPVFVFTHARETESNTVSYAHVGKLAATFGGIGVTLGYSNGPAASLTAAADDLSLVLEWLAENIAGYGGDPATLVLVAHSGGAMPAAAWLFGKGRQLPEGSGVAAAILSSGRFGELAPRILEVADAYDGEPVPLALWTAEYDPPEVAADVAALYALLCRKYDDCPWFEQIPGHNHLSQILSLGTDDSDVVNRLIRFYHTVR
jgi:triacylglycerol lipase